MDRRLIIGLALLSTGLGTTGCFTVYCPSGSSTSSWIGGSSAVEISEGFWTVSRTSVSPAPVVAVCSVVRTGPTTYSEYWLIAAGQGFPLPADTYEFRPAPPAAYPTGYVPGPDMTANLCAGYASMLPPGPARNYRHDIGHSDLGPCH
jgi:hypothetical protein